LFDHMAGNRVARVAVASALAVLIAALTVVSITESARRPSRSTATKEAPNILIVITDDQRPDMMRFMKRTRNLFGRQGVRYERAFATTPLCCPFRASLMTGQYAHNSGVRHNHDGLNLNHDHTLQRYLYEGGYRTALLGKFINGWPQENPPPYFERFVLGSRFYTSPVNVDGKLTEISQYLPNYLGKRAELILEDFERDDTDPWMMVLTPSSPHNPATPARRDRDVHIRPWRGNLATFERNLSDKPPTLYPGNTHKGVEASPRIETFARAARALVGADRLVSGVFDAVRALGEKSNTLAFFMSDNGFLMGEHGLTKKRYPYPMSQEIPLFMRWPDGGVPKGGTDRSIVANIDILPTVLEAAGLEDTLEHEIDGLSLRGSEERNRLLLEHFSETEVPTWASLITDREQYTEYYELEEETKIFTEYYDIVRDPWHLRNLLGDPRVRNDPDPLTLEALADQLEADRQCAGTNCP
jgi:arylsulfatase A-like enzyme